MGTHTSLHEFSLILFPWLAAVDTVHEDRESGGGLRGRFYENTANDVFC